MTECLPNLPRYIIEREDESWQGADHPDEPWRSIPAPQQALPWPTDGPAVQSREPASVVAEPGPLSPDTRAVMAAINGCDTPRITVAKAFRALAFLNSSGFTTEDQLLRILDAVTAELDWDARYHSHSAAAAALRAAADQAGSAKHWHVDQLRAIAAELEGSNG